MVCDENAAKVLEALWTERYAVKGDTKDKIISFTCSSTLNINIVPHHTDLNNLSYILTVKNTMNKIIENLTVVVAFQHLDFFDHVHFVDDEEFEKLVLAKTFISLLDIDGTVINVLEMKKPAYPLVLVTVYTHTPSESTSTSMLHNSVDQFMDEGEEGKPEVLQSLTKQFSAILTHLDCLISQETYKEMCHYIQTPKCMVIDDTHRFTQVYDVPLFTAKRLWGDFVRCDTVLTEFIPTVAENISRFVGYVLVKDIFVEFILIVISNEDSFRFECTTPYDALSKILIKEIKTKLFTFLKFQYPNRMIDLAIPDYEMEEQMIKCGLFDCLRNPISFAQHVKDALDENSDEESTESESESPDDNTDPIAYDEGVEFHNHPPIPLPFVEDSVEKSESVKPAIA